ncbi:hypothetical protein EMCRGX_G030102 [Ephydatia muelleri]
MGVIGAVAVDFVIDTGAAVSLVRRDVWEQIVKGDCALVLEQWAGRRLVGVNGAPLSKSFRSLSNAELSTATESHRTYCQRENCHSIELMVDLATPVAKGTWVVAGNISARHGVIVAHAVVCPNAKPVPVRACGQPSRRNRYIEERDGSYGAAGTGPSHRNLNCRRKVQHFTGRSKHFMGNGIEHGPMVLPDSTGQEIDGTTRFCVDYRKINEVTRKDAYPLTRVNDTLDTLAAPNCSPHCNGPYTTGYWQVKVAPEDQPKTAFTTPEGSFAPSKQSFGQLRGAGLKLKPTKCSLCQQLHVAFLSHIVSAEGIATDPSKTDAVSKWPTPLNNNRHFILDTDASDTGIGAVLSQISDERSERVIAYASRSVSRPEQSCFNLLHPEYTLK